jgi:hypothetical protein
MHTSMQNNGEMLAGSMQRLAQAYTAGAQVKAYHSVQGEVSYQHAAVECCCTASEICGTTFDVCALRNSSRYRHGTLLLLLQLMFLRPACLQHAVVLWLTQLLWSAHHIQVHLPTDVHSI